MTRYEAMYQKARKAGLSHETSQRVAATGHAYTARELRIYGKEWK